MVLQGFFKWPSTGNISERKTPKPEKTLIKLFLSFQAKQTYIALALGHIHGMLHIWRCSHIVVLRLSFCFLKLLLVQILWKDYLNCKVFTIQIRSLSLWTYWRLALTELAILVTTLLWAVSRVSGRVVKEPDWRSFLLASLYLLCKGIINWSNSALVPVCKSLNTLLSCIHIQRVLCICSKILVLPQKPDQTLI